MDSQIDSFSRYFPPDPESSGWGWRLLDAGRQNIAPHAPYPERGHPIGYLFDAQGHRTLDEFQLVLITEGRGRFESKSMPSQKINPGTALLLFPGEWHTYRPDPEIGWRELWIGFRGQDAERVVQHFFSPEKALIQVGQMDALIHVFEQLLHWVRQPIAGRDQVAASHIPLALAFLRAGAEQDTSSNYEDSQRILLAKAEFLQNIHGRTDLEALADKLGTSYSSFRASFKRHTGFSPREFENRMKLSRSRDLLLHASKSVSETADQLGYTSVYYYSRAFKKLFGQSPKQWLKTQRES